jgi:uncharacterized protein
MGRPVVHFEIIGSDGERARSYYSELFGWKIDADNPMNYGIVAKEDNPAPDGSFGIGGGVAGGYEGVDPQVTFYVAVPDVEEALARAERLGGTRVMGPQKVNEEVELGQFKDLDGNLVGLVKDAT